MATKKELKQKERKRIENINKDYYWNVVRPRLHNKMTDKELDDWREVYIAVEGAHLGEDYVHVVFGRTSGEALMKTKYPGVYITEIGNNDPDEEEVWDMPFYIHLS